MNPKRLLSLDGGGIRGLVAAEVLIKIEDIVKAHNPQVQCLADYFDFIGGTSTGSLLAVMLAKGMTARAIRDYYLNLGSKIFKRTFWGSMPFVDQLATKYDAKPLTEELQKLLVDAASKPLTLGSPELKTNLMLVSKNATTGGTWFFVSHPQSRFYNNNASLPLWQIARASSAAPTYFPPQTMQVRFQQDNGGDVVRNYEFIDGGMSPFNNPSFQLFLEVTKPDYNIGWATGEENLLMISIGTGYAENTIPFEKAKGYNALNWAQYAIDTLMEGANLQQNLLMQLISPKRSRKEQDIGPLLLTAEGAAFQPLLTYHRYTLSFTKKRFEGLGLGDIDPEKVRKLDSVDQVQALQRIGQAIAQEQVQESDFAGFLHVDASQPG